jgi:uncharacterized protein (TIGR02270 family)
MTVVTERPVWTGQIIPMVLMQHAEEAAVLWQLRNAGTRRGNFALMYLERFDRRLEAHLDGLATAGPAAWQFCDMALENPSPGAVFTATQRAIHERNTERLQRLFALALAVPDSLSGLISAFGWHERSHLRGLVAAFLSSPQAFERMIGIAACAMHRIDPGLRTGGYLRDQEATVRCRALRAVGELGVVDCMREVLEALNEDDQPIRFWGAWSAVLLGNRGRALDTIVRFALADGPFAGDAARLALQAMDPGAAKDVLNAFSADEMQRRHLIEAIGVAGDVSRMPWLIGQMTADATARVAGEAFSMITGVDLALQQLERKPPSEIQAGPSERASDSRVALDSDEGLPWPDAQRVQAWWDRYRDRYSEARYFMGAPVTLGRCIEVLHNGYQRQRIVAAHYLSLLEPGKPLFNTAAPAWRQRATLSGN